MPSIPEIPSLLRTLWPSSTSASGTSKPRESSLEEIFVDLVHDTAEARGMSVNAYGVWAIYHFEMARTLRTSGASIATPVISTSLYFVVFGGAIASRIQTVGGVQYGAFIVPGLIMLLLMTESISNASFGIYLPKFTGTKYEILSAPISAIEIIIGYVGAAATKSIVLGLHRARHRRPSSSTLDVAASGLGRVLPGVDLDRLQHVRLHHRHLGQELRAAELHPHADRDAADLPRRRLLFDRHAAAPPGAR